MAKTTARRKLACKVARNRIVVGITVLLAFTAAVYVAVPEFILWYADYQTDPYRSLDAFCLTEHASDDPMFVRDPIYEDTSNTAVWQVMRTGKTDTVSPHDDSNLECNISPYADSLRIKTLIAIAVIYVLLIYWNFRGKKTPTV